MLLNRHGPVRHQQALHLVRHRACHTLKPLPDAEKIDRCDKSATTANGKRQRRYDDEHKRLQRFVDTIVHLIPINAADSEP